MTAVLRAMPHRIRRAVRRPDVLLGTAIVASGLLVTGLGLGAIPRIWILIGTLILSVAGFTWVHSLSKELSPQSKIKFLHFTVATLMVFIGGVAAYSNLWDPSNERVRSYGFMLRIDDQAAYLSPSGYPGGPPLKLAKNNSLLIPMYGGQAYPFECKQVTEQGEIWLRFSSSSYWNGYWVAEADVKPAPGVDVSDVPVC